MTPERDDAAGLDALRGAIEDVAATLPSRAPRRASPGRARAAWAAAAAVLALAVGVVAWQRTGPPPPSRVVHVERYRIHGRDVETRLLSADPSGTVLVLPKRGAR